MDGDPEQALHHRQLDTDGENPAVQVAEIIAELEGKEADELASTYDQIDHILDHVFSDPPSPDARIRISFSYEGYRVTVEQDGAATFERVR